MIMASLDLRMLICLILLVSVIIIVCGCASTAEERRLREVRQQQAAERLSDALVDLIIESI